MKTIAALLIAFTALSFGQTWRPPFPTVPARSKAEIEFKLARAMENRPAPPAIPKAVKPDRFGAYKRFVFPANPPETHLRHLLTQIKAAKESGNAATYRKLTEKYAAWYAPNRATPQLVSDDESAHPIDLKAARPVLTVTPES